MNNIKDLICHIASSNEVGRDDVFKSIIGEKARTILDIAKVELTSRIFNNPKSDEVTDQ